MKKAIDYPDRSHTGSPDMAATSISIPKALLDELTNIAKDETRSRSAQIVHMLREAVKIV